MGQEVWDETTGARYWQDDDGTLTYAPEASVLEQAGRQFADLGSGIKSAAGNLIGRQDWEASAQQETDQRNRLMYGADQADPITSMVGQALPAVAAAPYRGMSLLGGMAFNTAQGGLESALDMGAGGHPLQRALAGSAAGLGGDMAGRLVGRVANGVRGIMDDITLRRAPADNALAQEFEEMGGATLASQRMAPGTAAQKSMERLEQGAQSSLMPGTLWDDVAGANEELVQDTMRDAIGLPRGIYDDMGPDTLRAANDEIAQGFSDVAAEVAEGGPIAIGDDLAGRIANTKGQVKDLAARGEFKGLDDGMLGAGEWTIARRALAQDAANAAGKGQHELADSIYADIDLLDEIVRPRLSPDTLGQYSRLREQYRVLQIAQKSGVIKASGEVSLPRLNNALQQGTGFGKTAKQGLETVNPESKTLIDLARVSSGPDFRPYRSSGTTENQALRNFVGEATSGPLGIVRAGAQLGAPVGVAAASRGGGRAVTGLATPASERLVRTGQMGGRGLLDEMLYPFVGIEDDRPQ